MVTVRITLDRWNTCPRIFDNQSHTCETLHRSAICSIVSEATLLIFLYFLVLGLLSLFGVHRVVLCWWARDSRSLPAERSLSDRTQDLPSVLIQLPMFNEKFVAEQVIRASVLMDYPKEKLQIQVLDDSTDETGALLERLVSELIEQGYPISLIHRTNRTGYKAGALAHGLKKSSAELVAIFDADFIPQPNFLQQIVPYLVSDPKLGMVQARWGHLNRKSNLLTRAQAIFLDGHFAIEHRGRNQAQRCFNFNGTAGVWRRQAIEDAGGWRAVTITEDFDLSYAPNSKAGNFVISMMSFRRTSRSYRAFRSQQAVGREVAFSLPLASPEILGASRWSLSRRFEALIHLSSNISYLLMAGLGLLLPLTIGPVTKLDGEYREEDSLSLLDLTMLTAGTLYVHLLCRGTSRHEAHLGGIGSLISLSLFALVPDYVLGMHWRSFEVLRR